MISELREEGWPRRVWPDHIPERRGKVPVRSHQLRATWVNHATVLVQVHGLNVLTDPVFSPAAGPLGQLGPRRRALPGLHWVDLPPIDLVLLSHNHYDHLDLPTLMKLWHRDRPRLYTGLGTGEILRRNGIPADAIVELDWWQSAEHAAGVVVSAAEVRHFSGRGLFDRDRTLWVGLHLKTPSGSVYFGGDSGFGPHYAETYRRLGAPDLALLPIGAFLPRSVMRAVHVDPAEAVMAHQQLGARHSLGIHWGTFSLGADGYERPVVELERARRAAGLADDTFVTLQHGDSVEIGESLVRIPGLAVGAAVRRLDPRPAVSGSGA